MNTAEKENIIKQNVMHELTMAMHRLECDHKYYKSTYIKRDSKSEHLLVQQIGFVYSGSTKTLRKVCYVRFIMNRIFYKKHPLEETIAEFEENKDLIQRFIYDIFRAIGECKRASKSRAGIIIKILTAKLDERKKGTQ